MMKLILTLALTFTLYSSAGALTCHTCDSPCSSEEQPTCDSETSCFTGTAAVDVGSNQRFIGKACAADILCPDVGSKTYSFNTSTYSLLADVECCNTSDCNSRTIPTPTPEATNNLTCCTDSDCNSTLVCRGVQDRCFQANASTISETLYGCASNNLCTFVNNIHQLPLASHLGNVNATCCEGNCCNAAVSMMANAWLLRLSVIHLLLAVYYFW